MTSLLDTAQNDAAVARIRQLDPARAPLWGKMNAAQMLAHCQVGFQVAAGGLTIKRGLIGKLFGGFAKKRFINGDAAWKRNLPTDPNFIVADASDFAAERDKLIDKVSRFAGTGATATGPHPFFGELTATEWDRLMWKHLDHHLRQFGV